MVGLLTALVALGTFGLNWIVYAHGFGFDPFIHQAAERYLVEHGRIELTSPLYAGQYGLIALLAWITRLPVDLLDKALVPILASAFAVWMFVRGLALWGYPRVSGLALFLMPFLPYTFTVPHHVVYVLLGVSIMLLPQARERRLTFLALSAFALATHPLLAVPLLVLAMCAALRERRTLPVFAAFATCAGIVGLFLLQALLVDGTFVWGGRASFEEAVRVLFAFPYTHLSGAEELLYRCVHVWPWILIALGTMGYLRDQELARAYRGRLLMATAFGTFLAAMVLAGGVRLPNILPAEQYEFALRLRYALPLFFLPGLFWMMERWMLLSGKNAINRAPTIWMLVCIAASATFVWYASYAPHGDAFRAAPGLGDTDIRVFEAIEREANGRPYFALTSQMVSAAALRGFGFERELLTEKGSRYPYAIPTGGELYQYYLRLWQPENVRNTLREACAFSRVPEGFIAIPLAWDPRQGIDARLRPFTTRIEAPASEHRVYRVACPVMKES